MLPSDAVLDEQTMKAVLASGHSRVPVHRPGERWAAMGTQITVGAKCFCGMLFVFTSVANAAVACDLSSTCSGLSSP